MRKVFVGEDFGAEPMSWSGRFFAHWEDGRDHGDGPSGVTVEEAIAWGRDQCDVVLVRAGDDQAWHSAGRVNPGGLPEWPEGRTFEPRRMRGYAHLDRTPEDPPIVWRVTVEGHGSFEVTARTYEEAVEAGVGRPAREHHGGPGARYPGLDARPAD